jgi:hypothetical protein
MSIFSITRKPFSKDSIKKARNSFIYTYFIRVLIQYCLYIYIEFRTICSNDDFVTSCKKRFDQVQKYFGIVDVYGIYNDNINKIKHDHIRWHLY